MCTHQSTESPSLKWKYNLQLRFMYLRLSNKMCQKCYIHLNEKNILLLPCNFNSCKLITLTYFTSNVLIVPLILLSVRNSELDNIYNYNDIVVNQEIWRPISGLDFLESISVSNKLVILSSTHCLFPLTFEFVHLPQQRWRCRAIRPFIVCFWAPAPVKLTSGFWFFLY